jgi:hypothetical protein
MWAGRGAAIAARARIQVTRRLCVPGEDGEDLSGIDARFAVGVVVGFIARSGPRYCHVTRLRETSPVA